VSLTAQLTEMLRAAVRFGEMKPGEHYSATGLAEKLGVPRTRVREASATAQKGGDRPDRENHLFLLGFADNPVLPVLDGELRNLVLAHGLVTIPSARSGTTT
jgi:hypothetical protein